MYIDSFVGSSSYSFCGADIGSFMDYYVCAQLQFILNFQKSLVVALIFRLDPFIDSFIDSLNERKTVKAMSFVVVVFSCGRGEVALKMSCARGGSVCGHKWDG